MNKILSILVMFALYISVSAQDIVEIYKSDRTVQLIELSTIDSIKFVECFTLNETQLSLYVGQNARLAVTSCTETFNTEDVIWKSSKENIATVQNGLVTALAQGKTEITALYRNKVMTCQLTVEYVDRLILNHSEMWLHANRQDSLYAVLMGVAIDNSEVGWLSNNTDVVTVKNGVIKTKKEGTATIIAAYGGQTATCTVTVYGRSAEETPVLAAPKAGFLRLAIRVPEGTCNGARGVGDFNSWYANDAEQAFTKVEGKEYWYYLDIDLALATQIKVVAVNEAGASGWATQWGMNTDDKENVTFITEADVTFAIDNSENEGEVKLVVFGADTSAAYNVYMDIKEWNNSPCNE